MQWEEGRDSGVALLEAQDANQEENNTHAKKRQAGQQDIIDGDRQSMTWTKTAHGPALRHEHGGQVGPGGSGGRAHGERS